MPWPISPGAPINALDTLFSWFSPEYALRRVTARRALSYYEATRDSRLRRSNRETDAPNQLTAVSADNLREQARFLDHNHDLARGILNTLVANVVGPHGIQIEPQPRRKNGEIHDELARQLERLYEDYSKRPEVTWSMNRPAMERLACRSWLRDGDVLAQLIVGERPDIDHGTRIPVSVELLEADYLPRDHNSSNPRIVQGVELNAWGRPRAYWFYRDHPGDLSRSSSGLKRVPAESVLHLKLVDRLHAVRGASLFASVLTRFTDLKDYEASEQIAAKVAASMAAYIKKGATEHYQPEDDADRSLKFRPGMIFDDLLPGEEIGTIDTSRPNANLEHYRNGQLRALAAGTGVSYSSASKNYDGTYSAQRQEMVEGYGAYGQLANDFISRFTEPLYEVVIQTAVLTGRLVLPADLDPDSLTDALYLPPQMPWIDPAKEADSWGTLEQHGHASGPEIIRRRGQKPRDVLDQQARWLRLRAERGLEAPQPNPKGQTYASKTN